MANIGKEVYKGVLGLAHSILDVVGPPLVPVMIVQAFGKSNPTPPYLAIQWPTLRPIGSPSRLAMGDDTSTVQKSVSEFQGYCNLYEVGEEDYIRRILSAIEDRDTINFTDSVNITLFVDGDIEDVPRLKGAEFEHERVCRIGVYVAVEHETATQTMLKVNVSGELDNIETHEPSFSLERSDP